MALLRYATSLVRAAVANSAINQLRINYYLIADKLPSVTSFTSYLTRRNTHIQPITAMLSSVLGDDGPSSWLIKKQEHLIYDVWLVLLSYSPSVYLARGVHILCTLYNSQLTSFWQTFLEKNMWMARRDRLRLYLVSHELAGIKLQT